MPPAFNKNEYDSRLKRVRSKMKERGLDALIIGNPSNINWLTGYDAWSFYTPQLMLIDFDKGPFWMGREMDAETAFITTYLSPSQVISYPENLVQKTDVHPSEFLSSWMNSAGFNNAIIGYESDSYYASPRSLKALKSKLKNAKWIEEDLLVNWIRLIKSKAELEVMYQAGKIAEIAMKTAWDSSRVGVRQCDLMADIIAAQIKGTPSFGGDMPALHPLILAGKAASSAHPMWTDEKLQEGQTISFELGGCRKRYNVGLARTIHLGEKKPQELSDTSKAVQEGMFEVMNVLKAGVIASDVHYAWQNVLNKHNLVKKSRIGYSIGLSYSPDWGEHTISFRAGEKDVVPENSVVHIILGMWMKGWGMELSETLHVRSKDCKKLSNFPQHVHLVS